MGKKSRKFSVRCQASSRVKSHLNGSRAIKCMLLCREMHVTELATAEEKGLVNCTEIKLVSVKDSCLSECRHRVKSLPGKHQMLLCWQGS